MLPTLPQVREDLLAQEPEGAQDLGLLHAGPLDTEDHGGDPETLAIARDFLGDARGITQEKAIARKGLEVRREALAGGKRLVLLPFPIRRVLGFEDGACFAHGARAIRRDVAFLDEGDLRRGRLPERLP